MESCITYMKISRTTKLIVRSAVRIVFNMVMWKPELEFSANEVLRYGAFLAGLVSHDEQILNRLPRASCWIIQNFQALPVMIIADLVNQKKNTNKTPKS